MKRHLVWTAVFLAALPLTAQVRRTEVVKATTPAEDSRGLSPDVPDSVALSTKIERVVLIRFRNQSDLLAGIEKHVQELRIRNAVILSGIGSALSAQYHVVSNRSFPSRNLIIENPALSADIANLSGYVLNGKIHAHITFADPDKAFGGHLEAGTRVFTFAVVTLGVLPDDIDVSRFDDKNWR